MFNHFDKSALAIAVFFLATTIPMISIRLVSRKIGIGQQPGLWWDDWLAFACLPLIMVICACLIYTVTVGTFMSPSTADLTSHPYSLALFLAKMSALLFYARVFHITTRFCIALYATAALNTAWIIGVEVSGNLIKKRMAKPGIRQTQVAVRQYEGQVATNVAIDVVILLLPLPILWSLQTNRRRKTELFLIFILGYSVAAFPLVRIWSLLGQPKNFQKIHFYMLTWNAVEPGIALISICVPPVYSASKFLLKFKVIPFINSRRSMKYARDHHELISANPVGGHTRDEVPSQRGSHHERSREAEIDASRQDFQEAPDARHEDVEAQRRPGMTTQFYEERSVAVPPPEARLIPSYTALPSRTSTFNQLFSSARNIRHDHAVRDPRDRLSGWYHPENHPRRWFDW